jgi:vacuolar-type H+-ATPase subunit H
VNLPEYLREVETAHREFRQQVETAAEGLDKRLAAAREAFHRDPDEITKVAR